MRSAGQVLAGTSQSQDRRPVKDRTGLPQAYLSAEICSRGIEGAVHVSGV